VNTVRKRLQRAEALVYERYVRSLTTEELRSLIAAIDRGLLAHGWTQAEIEEATERHISLLNRSRSQRKNA